MIQPDGLVVIPCYIRCYTLTRYTHHNCCKHVGKHHSRCANVCTDAVFNVRTYWMAGLAHDAAHFFKFLFILVLFSLAMTLFVRTLPPLSDLGSSLTPALELPSRLSIHKRGRRYPLERTGGTLSNDIRRLFRAPGRHPTRTAVAPVALSIEVLPGGALRERSR